MGPGIFVNSAKDHLAEDTDTRNMFVITFRRVDDREQSNFVWPRENKDEDILSHDE